MLEKILDSPLDCMEIKSVNIKENQFWIFIGRTDAEAPILWPIYTHICVPSLSVMSYSVWPHRLIHSHKKEWNLPLQQHGWTWMVLCLVKQDSSVQLLSHVQLFATPCIKAHQASLSSTNSQSLLKLMSIESVIPSNHLILCHPVLHLPLLFPSIRVFSNELVLASSGQSIGISASASVLPMNIQNWFPLGWTGLISVLSKGHSRSLLQHHSSKASILWPFFVVQLSHPYMTTRKTIPLPT